MTDKTYEPKRMWALVHSCPLSGRPFIAGILKLTRSEVIRSVERTVCGKDNWRKWSRETGAKIIKVTVSEGWDHD